jgi:ribosome-associated translation inhibitor RaiA
MRIAIRTAIGVPSELADLARRRLEFALGRFRGRIRSVTVRVADVNGPRGGVDKTCLATIRLDASKRLVVIEETDVDAVVAIDRAADRASRAVARMLHTLADRRASLRQGRS